MSKEESKRCLPCSGELEEVERVLLNKIIIIIMYAEVESQLGMEVERGME
jgi:hypothetical protein